MHVPDLSSLTLTPPDVADVGVRGQQCDPQQCDPRARTPGLCVVIRPTRWTLDQAKGLVPPRVHVNSTRLAFRINPSSRKWRTETPYDTLYSSGQYLALARILGYKQEFTLSHQTSGGAWTSLPEDHTWQALTSEKILNVAPRAPKGGQFWLKLRYVIPPTFDKRHTATVLMAMLEYNMSHPPLWVLQKRKDAEKAALASSRAAKEQAAPAPAPAPAPPPPAPPPPAALMPLSPQLAPLPCPEPPPELPTLEELFNGDGWHGEYLALMRDAPVFVV